MRFLSMIRIDEKTAKAPTERLMADMGILMEEMTQAGVLIETAGLRPTSEGVRVRLRGGKLSTIDGPFTEAKEVIGGYALVEVGSKEEAMKVARQFMELHRVHRPDFECECEVRPLEDM